jgi:uncharacterized protein (TIGR04255 family)
MMDHDAIPEPRDLRHKPLAEAIFELRWALTDAPFGHDPGFRILIGRYYDRVREQYPFMSDLPVTQVPEDMTPHVVRHQFRLSKDAWPLTQIGPGILTVNHTEGYTWDSFRPRLLKGVKALFESYPTDLAPLTITQVLLRYINTIPFDPSLSVTDFLARFLHTRIEVEPMLFRGGHATNQPTELNLTLAFPTTDPRATATLSFALGKKGIEPSIIWQLIVRSDGNDVPKSIDQFEPWLRAAHDTIIEPWFFALCRGDLLKEFEGNANEHR